MPYPASRVTNKNALDSINSSAVRLKGIAAQLVSQSAAGDTPRLSYIALQRQISLVIDIWDAKTGTPGLQKYARDQYDDQTIDLAVTFAAMRAAAVALRLWIFDNIPTHGGSGAALLEVYDLRGDPTNIMVPSAGSAGFRSVANDFILTVD